MIKFYDTSSLLLLEDFTETIVISSITLFELEEIKSSMRKDEEVRAAARNLLRLFDSEAVNYKTIIYNSQMLKPIEKTGVEINNDAKILATALYYNRTFASDDMIFVSNDLSQKTIASLFLDKKQISSVIPVSDDYTGYLDLTFTEEELTYLYEHPEDNSPYGLHINQYLIIRAREGDIVDRRCWTGETLRPVKFYTFNSRYFGEVKPKSNDVF